MIGILLISCFSIASATLPRANEYKVVGLEKYGATG